ncbi:MAG: hypothetical protein FWF18_03380 [Dehalococcoidia bacterium]|nr:hypothetical protein [Dehalococcoidia bacterium]
MESSWKQTLAQLEEYVMSNPSIIITRGKIVMPGEVRDGFYELFDRVENEFTTEHFASEIAGGAALSAAWYELSQRLTERMELESIVIAPSLRWLLENPLTGLSRYLFDDLFAVLKGTMDADAFEAAGKARIAPIYAELFKEGYRKWATLALLEQLDADRNFFVPAADNTTDNAMGEGHENPGQKTATLPEAEPCSMISFQQPQIVSFVVPKILVHSTKLGRYASLHSEFVEPFWTAQPVSERVEWFDYDALKTAHRLDKVRPDIKNPTNLPYILPDIAVHTMEYIEDLVMVTDHSRIARPDLNVEIMDEADWYEKGKMADVLRRHRVMQPRYGSYVICREEPPQAAFDELAPKPVETNPQETPTDETSAPPQPAPAEPPLNIHLVATGYDVTRLAAVIEALPVTKVDEDTAPEQ